jgi:hypothetical protein
VIRIESGGEGKEGGGRTGSDDNADLVDLVE